MSRQSTSLVMKGDFARQDQAGLPHLHLNRIEIYRQEQDDIQRRKEWKALLDQYLEEGNMEWVELITAKLEGNTDKIYEITARPHQIELARQQNAKEKENLQKEKAELQRELQRANGEIQRLEKRLREYEMIAEEAGMQTVEDYHQAEVRMHRRRIRSREMAAVDTLPIDDDDKMDFRQEIFEVAHQGDGYPGALHTLDTLPTNGVHHG